MDKKRKIVYGILLAIILIGIIVVIFKGFNVGLSLKSHDTFKFVFEQKYEVKDIKNICREVLKNKTYRIRGVEVFDDAVYIEAEDITEEEQKMLADKLEKLYQNKDEKLENSEESKYEFFTDSNIRLRDEAKVYIVPVSISAVIILIYVSIRFKKLNDGKIYVTLFKLIIESLLLALLTLSVFAIVRIPVEKTIFALLIMIEMVYLVIKFTCMENKLKKI